MVVLNCANAVKCLEHVLSNVLEQEADSPLCMAFKKAQVQSMFDLLAFSHENIDDLDYDKSDTEKNVKLPMSTKNLVRVFLFFLKESPPITNEECMAMTKEDFDLYRIDPSKIFISGKSTPSPSPPAPSSSSTRSGTSSTASTSSTSRYTPAELFKRGIKRDPSLFPVLKDERFNDQWHRSFNTQAHAQDVQNVLNPKYKPTTPELIDLFKEQQKYVYAVLEKCLLTDRGKKIVREHESDYDAQKVYDKIKQHHMESTKARTNASKLLTYITSTRLGNGEWRGTTEGFIIHYQDQIRLYERLVDKKDHFSEGQKQVMLQNAVNGIDDLRQVKTTAELDESKSGKKLTYDQYTSLLLSAASTYDEKYSSKKPTKRSVYMHDLLDPDDDDSSQFHDMIEDFDDIDLHVSTLQAHVNESRPPFRKHGNPKPTGNPVRMPRDRWMSLSNDARSIWDKLPDKEKAIILGLHSDPPKSQGPFKH